jgi:hypothetical protein
VRVCFLGGYSLGVKVTFEGAGRVLQPAPSEVTCVYKHQPKSSFKVTPNLP